MEARSDGGASAPIMAVVGGIVAVVGSLLTWAGASVGPASFSARGIDGWEGKVTMLGGVILLVAGVSAFVGSADARKRLGRSAILGGMAAAGVAIYTAATARDQIVDAAAGQIVAQAPGTSIEEARGTLDLALDQGLLTLTLEVGIWLVIVGGMLGVVAGTVAMLRRQPAPRVVSSAGGAGLVGWASTASAPGSIPEYGSSALPVPMSAEHSPPSTSPGSSVWAVPSPPPPQDREGADVHPPEPSPC